MTSPVIAGRAPLGTEVEAGKTYYWCSCGQSTKQPFCDGSHKATIDEEEGKLYEYDASGARKEINE